MAPLGTRWPQGVGYPVCLLSREMFVKPTDIHEGGDLVPDERGSIHVGPEMQKRLERSLDFRRRETGFKISMAEETARLLSDALAEREKLYKKPGGGHAHRKR